MFPHAGGIFRLGARVGSGSRATKGPTVIELSPGQEIPLVDDTGEPLVRLRMGVGWDHNPTAGFIASGAPEIDLDASAVLFGDGQLYDLAFYNNLSTRDGSVVHAGDNISGRGEGDDESLTVDLTKVHPKIDTIVFLVSSYQGHTLEWVHNAYCRLVDDRDVELARFTLSLGVPETGLAMAKIFRDAEGFRLRAIGDGIKVTVPTESVRALQPYV
jgi:stress response protein SCP2